MEERERGTGRLRRQRSAKERLEARLTKVSWDEEERRLSTGTGGRRWEIAPCRLPVHLYHTEYLKVRMRIEWRASFGAVRLFHSSRPCNQVDWSLAKPPFVLVSTLTAAHPSICSACRILGNLISTSQSLSRPDCTPGSLPVAPPSSRLRCDRRCRHQLSRLFPPTLVILLLRFGCLRALLILLSDFVPRPQLLFRLL